ncbi:hypothetical protein AXW83_14895 [Bosea sp. PAMC 26642]|nr:hypothetical protein AXW83_14895 [Bosea sp. PAMC 26642]
MITQNAAGNDTASITIELSSKGQRSYGSKFKIGKMTRYDGVVIIHCTMISGDATYTDATIRVGLSSLSTLLTKAVMSLPDHDAE